MSFKLKIILGVTVIQAVLLLVIILNGMEVLRSSNEQALLQRTDTTVKLFAATTQEAVLSGDLAGLEGLVKDVLANPGITYARVISAQGIVLAQRGAAGDLNRSFSPDTDLTSAARDGVFDATADIRVSGDYYGRVEMGFSTAAILETISKTRRQTWLLAVVSLVLVTLFSYALGTYLTRQLRALQEGTQQVAGGVLGFTVKVKGRDELAQTARAFNDMSARLLQLDTERSQSEAKIRKLNAELGQRVADRTVQLEELNKELQFQALHDALTKLPNRILFRDRLDSTYLAAKRGKEPFALVGIDLDMFKEINDSLGHLAGDLVLQHVARACTATLRESDTVARLGGMNSPCCCRRSRTWTMPSPWPAVCWRPSDSPSPSARPRWRSGQAWVSPSTPSTARSSRTSSTAATRPCTRPSAPSTGWWCSGPNWRRTSTRG